MKRSISQKMIKEKCGTASFKRGDAFYRGNKVKIARYSEDLCKATVIGAEDFHVEISIDENLNVHSGCSCPKLASFDKECQHVAAVLLWIANEQQKSKEKLQTPSSLEPGVKNVLTEGFLTLFHQKPTRGSGHQHHFETREVMDAEFILSPLTIGEGRNLISVEMKIGGTKIRDIRRFLSDVKEGKASLLSSAVIFDPKVFCFDKETDEVVQQLVQVVRDEQAFWESDRDRHHVSITPELLLIPPSSWEPLKGLLTLAPEVMVTYRRQVYSGLKFSDAILPLQFVLTKPGDKGHQLQINGLNDLILLPLYQAVLAEGEWIELKSEDSRRLQELKGMLDASKTNRIPVPEDQLEFFLEKVVPGLRRLGEVQLPGVNPAAVEKKPLVAKLFLDRVKDRLLAGLEFCYGDTVINPLERDKSWSSTVLFREKEKEEEILALMEESSFTETESGYYLHHEELEYTFLHHIVPRLKGVVQLYATTAIRNRIFKEHAPPKISVRIKKERTNWLEFKFEMEGFPEREIRALLAALEEKRKYYRLRDGSLFSLETREIEEIRRFLEAAPIQPEDLEQEFEMPIVQGLRLLDSVENPDFFAVEESFRQFLEQLKHPDFSQFEVPKSLDGVLRDYQKQGYSWMKLLASYGFGGVLADDMGLGKTLQSITFLLSELPMLRQNNQQALIVCPSSVMYNWLSEFMQFAPEIEAVVLDGSVKERREIQRDLSKVDVIITSYPLIRKDSKWYETQHFHTIFFDEAQAFKNPVTQTARAVKSLQAVHRFGLTGTPVENSIEELWSLFHVIFPELFQSLSEYSHLSRKAIARRVRPFMLRRMKEDVLDELPEKLEIIDSTELLPDQKKLYAAYLAKLRHDTLKHLDKDTIRKNRIKILAGLTRLRQICCHPGLFVEGYKGRSAKFEQLQQILEESRLSGRRVLIFSQFTKMLGLIGKELKIKGEPYFYLDGQTPSEERVEICSRFNSGERDLILVSLKAGGTGLNLTGADTVILYDTWWNPAVEEQAADRAHRMGQKKSVQVIKLIARGTIEEKMNELQDKKRHLIKEIVDQDKNEASSLTEEDIRELLRI
ncbi:DEAD/DEAH box helicase [Jeotgalibacillus proteolyticus]|uniref:Helicase SNF n=1 Tax=Jeotgalibacillus proteolyticus TaxID=2082395 RepID=A0A2S5GDH7_9BACL|nr:DEAD/DEAH box helicase [Jeotgalibacillus proteolyticus]PPA71008.1 helicase SNF [Jeotgalibacillus proteolyticus]